MKFLLLLPILALSACAPPSTTFALMQNPKTKQTAKCEVDPWIMIGPQTQLDHCMQAYKKAGFVRIDTKE